MARLSGKIAIVTGAASGIGKAAFDLFRAEGATVVGADVSEGADHLVDAGREGDVKALVERVAGEHGGLHTSLPMPAFRAAGPRSPSKASRIGPRSSE